MSIQRNIEAIRKKIQIQACNSGYNPQDIVIVCVTKNRSLEEIYQVLEAGITHIGENKVQEAVTKFQAINEYAKNKGINLNFHMVGHLQTNKVDNALEIFNMIQSVDSLKLADKINIAAKEKGKPMDILLEVNASGEKTKFGISLDETIPFLKELSKLDYIRIRGLMTMAPLVKNKEHSRPYFRHLRKLRDEINKIVEPIFKEKIKMDFLSMGMSQDYEVAVREGANMLRIGSAIFK